MPDDNAWDDPDAHAWLEQAEQGMAPMLRASAFAMQIMPDNDGDAKFWVELGASIMMNKPLLVLAVEGRVLPPKLALVADRIVRISDLTKESLELAAAEVAKFAASYDKSGE